MPIKKKNSGNVKSYFLNVSVILLKDAKGHYKDKNEQKFQQTHLY